MLHAFNIILICGCSNVDVEEMSRVGWMDAFENIFNYGKSASCFHYI